MSVISESHNVKPLSVYIKHLAY